ncbi:MULTISPECIES: helix-turn-helix transcriptional regulator [unclassified Streptomyces]|uniref:helix-turn-helix domain-containing protein n=1 Tax=unclassified Streptomyces TaxID=2593676 RepID=UPI0023658C32|nr:MULTISPECIES: helix-turn-helix transcriptional regulator [unclassified Streptomyces]MDF3142310.1 helix-turn-helix transcriptional regulator [Streptomyces sp. T21Q-yed]WDF40663.1 helix-turn-helix transcriptional regulator [Streptomyces sp. T12]
MDAVTRRDRRPGADRHPEALAFGKALYDRRMALGLTSAELAERAGMPQDEIECSEEGGTQPTVGLLRVLAAALDADVRLTAGHDIGSLSFDAHVASERGPRMPPARRQAQVLRDLGDAHSPGQQIIGQALL